MNTKSQIISTSITTCWNQGQEVLSTTQQLYNLASESQHQTVLNESESGLSTLTSITIHTVSCYAIWDCLGECNVYDASMVCTVFYIYYHIMCFIIAFVCSYV
jgi:hypothetical protein